MFKVLDKDLYWSMIDDNHCTEDVNKYWEFFEKSKGAEEAFDRIVNRLFNTNDEVINYLFTEKSSRTKEALVTSASYNKYFKFNMSFPINNSYFIHVQEKQCKKIDAKKNNIIAFISNVTSNTKIEVYLSETNFHKYCYKIDKVVPVVVFNLPEYAQDKIYDLFYRSLKKIFIKNDFVNAQINFSTHYPIANAKKRNDLILERKRLVEELLRD